MFSSAKFRAPFINELFLPRSFHIVVCDGACWKARLRPLFRPTFVGPLFLALIRYYPAMIILTRQSEVGHFMALRMGRISRGPAEFDRLRAPVFFPRKSRNLGYRP